MAFRITPGSRDGCKPLEALTASLGGKVFADQGYLCKALLLHLWQRGFHRVTGIGRNRKNDLPPLLDKVLLRKRCIIGTLFARLKSSMGLEHTRHRWPVNALVQPKVNIGNFAIPNPMPAIPGNLHLIYGSGD